MADWHVDPEVLRRWGAGHATLAEGTSVEQHLLACGPCRARANEAAADVLDFDAVWTRTRDAIEVPTGSWFERLLRRVGLPAVDARLVAVSSAFRQVWFVGVATVLVFATLAASFGHTRGLWLFLGIAPIAPCIMVGFSYDPRLDPALEPELVTPYPAIRLVLLRTVAVLVVALPTVLVFGLLTPLSSPVVWLLPAVGFVAVVLAASTWIPPLRAAIAVSVAWLAAVSSLAARSTGPATLQDARWQLGFCVLAAGSLVIFLVRRQHLRELRPWR